MRVEISRRGGVLALLLATNLLCAGCSGKGVGDTVPSPPRELVEKSFHPPANGVPSGNAASKATPAVSAPAGK